MLLSAVFTNTTPSRVHVSRIFLSRFRLRASQAIVARVFVKSSLINMRVPFSFLALRMMVAFMLCVVKRTMTSRGVCRSSVLRPTRCERTTSWSATRTSSLRAASSCTIASVFSPAVSGTPLMRTVFRLEYCSKSSHRSSRTPILPCRSTIWASLRASVSANFVVSVVASPRSS